MIGHIASVSELLLRGVRAVLFDKDGTLLEFDATWRPIADHFEEECRRSYSLGDAEVSQLREALGIHEQGFSPDSVFVQGTARDMIDVIHQTLAHKLRGREELTKRLMGRYAQLFAEGAIRPVLVPGCVPLVERLVACGYVVGIATSDSREATLHFLHGAGLEASIDFIGCDDGETRQKPATDIAVRMCSELSLRPGQIAMVGDSLVDMQFARNAGLGCAIYIDSGYRNTTAGAMADIYLGSLAEMESLF